MLLHPAFCKSPFLPFFKHKPTCMKFFQKQLLTIASFSILLLAGCKSKTTNEEKAPLVPLEDFFKNADKSGWQISPDGESISYLSPHMGHTNVFVRKITDSVGTPVTHDSSGTKENSGQRAEPLRTAYQGLSNGGMKWQVRSRRPWPPRGPARARGGSRRCTRSSLRGWPRWSGPPCSRPLG